MVGVVETAVGKQQSDRSCRDQQQPGQLFLPLKILWVLLDLLTIAVLISGLYLWFKRGSTQARVSEIERAGLDEDGRAGNRA